MATHRQQPHAHWGANQRPLDRCYAIDSDHLNTPRRLTNTQGPVVWQWLITGYGEVAPTTGATGYAFEAPQLGGSTNTSGTVYSEEVNFKLRYPGQVWDEETGLSYNLNRYYDAQAGRYVQSDPIGLEGGWNRFGYVGGDPLSFTDDDGLQARPPRMTTGPSSVATLSNTQALGLLNQIRRYDSGFRYETVRTTGSKGNTQGDVNALTSLLRAYERNQSCPALPGSPYAPETVARRVRPEYQSNPAHDPRSPLFNPRKTPEPADACSMPFRV